MKSTSARPLAISLLIALLCLLPAGCGTPAAPPDAAAAGASSRLATPTESLDRLPSWPSPPAPARIRYLRSIAGPHDWGISKSTFWRLIDGLAGDGVGHFVRPTGVAEREGVLYVADPGAQALWILDAERNRTEKVDHIGDVVLASPVAVAVRPDGSVFVADSRLKTIFLLDRAGKLISAIARQGLERPAGLAYDAAKRRLYVADSVNHRIVVLDNDANVLQSWGRPGHRDGEFNYPTHLALDPSGVLLVSDALNFRVQAFDADGRFLWKLGRHGDASGDIAAPKGVASDSEGHVFLVDALFDAVQIFDRDGRYLLGFGERGSKAGQFWLPGGIFVNPHDEIYVADAYNQRIQVFRVVGNAEEKQP